MNVGPYYLAHPAFLLLLVAVPAMIVWYAFYHKKSSSSVGVSTALQFYNAKKTFRHFLLHFPFVLRLLAVILVIITLTQPESRIERSDFKVEGIDILIASDISGSMLAQDFKPNRLEASKEVAMEFIDGRPDDRIGLIAFSAESFLQCPLTIDHLRLKNLYAQIQSGMITDGTAIGDGLGLAVYHLKKSKALSKVIILLTDGINNTGSLDPMTAAEIAKKFGIRVYTIGVGTKGMAPYPFMTPYGIQYQNAEVQIDEDLLKKIAEFTGGNYFRATNKEKLRDVYQQIDKMEKSKIDVTRFSKGKPEFLIFAIGAALCIFLELMIQYLFLKRIP
jgi:Ca-activated chloride channel family protein